MAKEKGVPKKPAKTLFLLFQLFRGTCILHFSLCFFWTMRHAPIWKDQEGSARQACHAIGPSELASVWHVCGNTHSMRRVKRVLELPWARSNQCLTASCPGAGTCTGAPTSGRCGLNACWAAVYLYKGLIKMGTKGVKKGVFGCNRVLLVIEGI